MKNDDLIEKGNVLRIQNHQLTNSSNKISEINSLLETMTIKQKKILEDNKLFMENIESSDIDISKIENYDEILLEIELELSQSKQKERNIDKIEKISSVEFNQNMSWNDYLKSIEDYSFRNNINLKEDPFKHIMTKTQQVELEKRIKDEFSLKNANCDKYDYMIAGTCGIIAGLVDILFVGVPKNSELGDIADEQANNITEKFAEFLGWNKDKAAEKGSNTTASAIGFLEKKFKINYDHATTHATGGAVENLSLKNHHLKGLGHSPDIIGLFFSVLNQFTNTSSFISNGQIITIDTEEFELQGHNLIAKIFCGVANWFGHIMSDWTGSSGTVGQGGRGTGVPIPFYNLLQMLNIGEFGKDKQSFATITTKVFEEGYDARHGMAMAIPVVINELLIRFMYTMKAHFYHQKDWKDSIPSENIPELRRMLLVGHGTLCIMDGADAAIRSGGEMVQFLLRTNLIAWVRFGHLGLKELNAWYNSGHIDSDAVDKYIDDDLKQMLNKNR
jgi:hypothetical protein